MRTFIGTSGFSYPKWKGSFYPDGLPASRMLEHYASKLPSVELNNTFYRMPSEKTLDGWKSRVPDGFRFSLKAPQTITHRKRLRDCGEPLSHFVELSRRLGDRLGVLLFQLPPNFPYDLERLERCLDGVSGMSVAFEFRHASWFEHAEVPELLRQRGCGMVAADTPEAPLHALPEPMPLHYLRLRCDEYSPKRLRQLAKLVPTTSETPCYIYCKHETQAPQWADTLQDLLVR